MGKLRSTRFRPIMHLLNALLPLAKSYAKCWGDFKAKGKRVVGYGAPAKATTLCYAFGIDGSMLEYIIDDSKLKQGLFMPGTHIPIKPSSTLYDDKPDYCLILAWNFADSIAKNNQKFVDNGGVFISPVPEPHVLS
jgi:hypothetical protein